MADPVDEITERNESWALTFPGSTNIRQRQRRAQDIARGQELRDRRALDATEQLLRTDDGARRLYVDRERLNQADQRLRQQQSNFEAGQERLLTRDIFDTEMKARKAELDELNAQRLMRKELFDTDNARRMLEQTTRAEQNISDHIANGILPGSKDYAERALRTIAQNPMIDPKARASILGSAKILGEEDEFDTAWNKLTPDQQARATVVDDPKGWRISVAPEKGAAVDPAKRLETLRKEYDAVTKTRASLEGDDGKLRAGFSEDDRLFYDDDKRRIMAEIKGLQSANAPAAQSASTAQRPVFKDAAGNRAYKNPDGSFEPIP